MTESLEDYLESIYIISKESHVARVKEIAEKMNVKKPSVINALKELSRRELINQEKYGYIQLTELGKEKAENIFKRHVFLKKFLHEIIGVSDEISELDACRIEHYLHNETIDKLKTFFDDYKK